MAWALHLWSVVLPAIVLLVLVRRRADRLVAGFGTIAAVSLGTATLVLPFSSVFFSHVLSALLGFGAFALLARERGSPSLPIAAAAGFLAGLACTVEYSLVIVAAALGVLILTGTNRIQRALAYSAAVALGVLPAFLFNTWAFGTPLHFPYEGWHRVGEKPLPGVFGITTPTLHNLLKILFYPGGIGPLLLAGVVGAVLLWRKGLRTEAALPVLVAAAFILADAASSTPFGGVSPGPRYVIPALPFLALPLAAAYRAFPGATLGLMIGGGTFMVAATMTTALEAWDGLVAHRLATGDFVDSVASFVGLESSATAVPFALAVAVAAAAAVAATPWPKTARREIVAGVAALAGWLLISTHMTDLLKRGLPGELIALASFVVATAIVVASYRASAPTRPRPMRSSES